MKLKLPKIKIFQALLSLKYLYWFVALIAVVVAAILGFFLYKNFYQTITSSEEIILLKSEVAPDTINMKKVEAILKALAEKTAANDMDWQKIRNPFNMPIKNTSVTPPQDQPAAQPQPPVVE